MQTCEGCHKSSAAEGAKFCIPCYEVEAAIRDAKVRIQNARVQVQQEESCLVHLMKLQATIHNRGM